MKDKGSVRTVPVFPMAPRRTRIGPLASAAIAGFLAACVCTACGGPKSFSAGTVPFPAQGPVFLDASGRPQAGLPDSPEPYRLILFDYVWCPPCADVWTAIREASREIPAGSVHVYRILFDRERLIAPEGASEVDPIRPPPPPDAGTFPVTTVAAIPRAFRDRFEPEKAPVLLLTDRQGKVIVRWTGASHSLSAAIAAAIRSVSTAPPRPET